jgi:amino acid adenylation domain-containing protein
MNEFPIVRRLLDLPPAWGDREVFRSTAGSLTFAGLRDGMLRIAGWLAQDARVRPGDRIAICLPRSLETVQIIYGILAAGAAYVPLHFQGPAARQARILASTRPSLLLTTPEWAGRLRAELGADSLPPLRLIPIAEDGQGLASLPPATPSASACATVQPDDLAVILFTSGSTGEPKGVMLSHRYIQATAAWVQERAGLDGSTRMLSHAGLQYVTSLELFFPLLSGFGFFLLTDREAMFPDFVTKALERERVTNWWSSSTALRLLVEEGGLEARDLGALRRVEFFGEPLPTALLRRLMAALPQAAFANIYGATEAYNMLLFAVPRPLPDDMKDLPLGIASGGGVVTLLDEDGREAPPGAVGEICTTGPRTMLGYWDNPELTEAKRIGGAPGTYRSGDLAYRGDDGLFRLVGRRDQLVKLRGHRFDLSEIEATIKRHPDVRDAVAFALPMADGETAVRAVAWVAAGTQVDAELRRLCVERLPIFARPLSITALEHFPLLPTGKIDRQALKAMVSAIGRDEPPRAGGSLAAK